jgi:hypothetical protein
VEVAVHDQTVALAGEVVEVATAGFGEGREGFVLEEGNQAVRPQVGGQRLIATGLGAVRGDLRFECAAFFKRNRECFGLLEQLLDAVGHGGNRILGDRPAECSRYFLLGRSMCSAQVRQLAGQADARLFVLFDVAPRAFDQPLGGHHSLLERSELLFGGFSGARRVR